jgi:hypothetical protein
MNLNKPFQKLVASSFALSAVLLLAQLKCAAFPSQLQEQEQSQSQQQPPPPSPTSPPTAQPASDPALAIGSLPVKRRKVWTNDDVVMLRTPTDDYLAEKEAKQAADAEAAAKEAARKADTKSANEPPLDIKLPDSPEETEKMLKSTLADIQEETVVVERLHKELLESPTEQQEAKQSEIDRLTQRLEVQARDVRALQEHLATLRGKPQAETSPALAYSLPRWIA